MAVHVKNEPRNDYELTAYNQKDSDSWGGNNYYYKATVKTPDEESDSDSESESDQTSESGNDQTSESEG